MKKFLLAMVLIGAGIAQSFASWNGRPISNPQSLYPSVVNLRSNFKDGYGVCTGTLFRAEGKDVGFILTAAHCVYYAKTIDVIFNSGTANNNPIVKRAARWVRHRALMMSKEPFGLNQEIAHKNHDVAVIMVEGIPKYNEALPILKEFKPEKSNHLWAITRKVQELYKISSTFLSVPLTNSTHISANGSLDMTKNETSLLFDSIVIQPNKGSRGICSGDSGGPIISYRDGKPYIVGVMSMVYDIFASDKKDGWKCGKLAIYYNVTYNHSWIDKAVGHLLKSR
jgi:secreted trypsin-like serine protease